MKKTSYLILITLLIISCKNDPEQMIQHLEGYWEINEVHLNTGEIRQYKINQTIDYFNVDKNLSGYRKKMKPNFSGTYETSKDKEEITLRVEDDSLHIYYTTPYAKWKETILEISPSKLKIMTPKKDVYIYKRYIPLNLE